MIRIDPKAINEGYFWAKVDKVGKCWEWRGRPNKKGYGTYNSSQLGKILAHRVAWALATGQDPGDFLVCHTCDNPPCCNPDHLWLGTAQQNMIDMASKGRNFVPDHRGEKHPKSKLTEVQVVEIRNSNESARTLAIRYGVKNRTVYNARSGTSWAYLEAGA